MVNLVSKDNGKIPVPYFYSNSFNGMYTPTSAIVVLTRGLVDTRKTLENHLSRDIIDKEHNEITMTAYPSKNKKQFQLLAQIDDKNPECPNPYIVPCDSGKIRTEGAAEYYHEQKNKGNRPCIIFSGGKTDLALPALSVVYSRYAVENYNVPAEASYRYCEKDSIDTTENAEFSAKKLRELGLTNHASLVTQRDHMKRALYVFKKHGVRPKAVVAENYSTSYKNGFRDTDNWQKRMLQWIKGPTQIMLFEILGEKWFRDRIHRQIEKYGRRLHY